MRRRLIPKSAKLFVLLFPLFVFGCGRKNPSKTSDNELSEPKEIIRGSVVRVVDGDTFIVSDGGELIKVRLTHIDAPEKDQPFGSNATDYLKSACLDTDVVIYTDKKDRYGRYLGLALTNQGDTLNLNLVRAGLAWHYKKYSADSSFSKAEQQARVTGMGLWLDSSPTEPWEWRRSH
jgi:endonuclease YncB( thermonuclease family)